jgi:hypothetical protein
MFTSNLFRDETELRQFLADVERDLRAGRAEDAAERVDFALGVLDEFGHPIAAMCRAYPASAIRVHGWDKLTERLQSLDQPDKPITAISIDLSAHGEVHADSDDAVAPYLETNFYNDGAFAFSTVDRDTLCAGYGDASADWQGNFEDIDGTIEISGIGRLNVAIDALKNGTDDPLISDAMVFAVTYRAVAVHLAVQMMIANHGLPRPLTIIVGSNDSYPFFDAPVITANEYVERFGVSIGADTEDEPIDCAADNDQMDDDVDEAPQPATQDTAPSAFDKPPASGHLSGSEIRRRFAEPAMIVEQKVKSGLLSRILRR